MARIKTEKDVSRKEVILKSAARLFRERGYKATSMRDLAEDIGIEAASLYNHISSKAELLHDICFQVTDIHDTFMEELMKTSDTSLRKIEKLIRFQVKQMVFNFDFNGVANDQWMHLSAEDEEAFRTRRHLYRKHMNQILTKGVQQGELKEQINVPATIWLILNAIYGLESWHRSRVQGNVHPEDLEENMVLILISGIKK